METHIETTVGGTPVAPPKAPDIKPAAPPPAVKGAPANDNTIREAKITASYKNNYVLYLPVVREGLLTTGTVRVRVPAPAAAPNGAEENPPEAVKDIEAIGALNAVGYLSGMARVYSTLSLKPGDVVRYRILAKNEILIVSPALPAQAAAAAVPAPAAAPGTVFKANNFNHIHFEAFRPENLYKWDPKAEPDIYMAFGILSEYTEYQYCCGVNAQVLKQLGANIEPKPDAIFIDRRTGEYLMVEFEMYSKNFSPSKHKVQDIDLLVCWEDDEEDRNKVPKQVLALKDKAREAARELLDLDPEEAE